MATPRASSHENLYFKKLKFDPKLLKTPFAKYLTNFRYVFLLILIIVTVGITSYLSLPRRLNPQIKIPIVIISTVLPGAGPQDVESLVTQPVEDSVSGLPNINTVTSISQENISIVTMEFNSGVNPDKAKDDVQSQVDSITTIPKDAKTPKVQKLDFENQPVLQFLVSTSSDTPSLMQFADNLKEKLKKLTTIKDVTLTGFETEEVQILLKPEAQKTYGIDSQTLSKAVQTAVPAYPSGAVNTENSSFSLTIDSSVKSVSQLRDLEIIVNGQPLKVSDIAEISQKSSPNQSTTYWADPNTSAQRAVALSIYKTESANIDHAVNDAKNAANQELKNYPGKFNLVSLLDTNELITKQFNDVLNSFESTIILVIITLFIFLGLRQALIVAFSIPLSFLIAFTVMRVIGLTINFLTLFSLILALGLLVDDAIVVVTAVTAYWRTRKFTPNQTGLLVIRDFIVPIWSTTITAVWAFLPLLLSTGIIGEFIKSIPIVVSSTLIASTAIAVLITLPTAMLFLKPAFPKRVKYLFYFIGFLFALTPIFYFTNATPFLPLSIILAIATLVVFLRTRQIVTVKIREKYFNKINLSGVSRRFSEYSIHGVIDSQKYAHWYEKKITKIISSKSARRKTLAVVIIFAIFAYFLVPLGFVVNEFFPKADQDYVFLSIELPPGTNLETTKTEALRVLEELRSTTQLKYVTVQLGQSLDVRNGGQNAASSNNALFTLNLTPHGKRPIASYQIADMLREKYKNYLPGKASVLEESGGPPAGADIQIKLLGDDLSVLNTYSDKVIGFLQKQPGVVSVQKSITPGTSKIIFIPDRAKMAENSITEDQIGNALRSFASGQTISTDVKFDSKNHDIILRSSGNTQKPQDLSSLNIHTQSGREVPLIELGHFELAQNPTQITREDGKRTISVSAGVTKAVSISQTNTKLETFAKTDLKLLEGYEWKTGGVNEENQKSVNSILQAMVLAFLLIAATMVLQFGSYRKAFIILLLIPLAISGVFVVFALSGTPLSFPTLIGILALFGIVVYQAMMIVDKINRNLKTTNMSLKEAIADAGASRVEPILFGTITTVVGLIPITLSDPLWRGLGGAIIAGMLFSGVVMLLFIPVVYYMIYQNTEGQK